MIGSRKYVEAWKCKALGVQKSLVAQKPLKSKMRRTTRIRRDAALQAALEDLHLQDRADRRERGRQEEIADRRERGRQDERAHRRERGRQDERAHRRERGRAQEFVQRRLRRHEEIAAHRQVCYLHS